MKMTMFDDCIKNYSFGNDASVFALLELLVNKGIISLDEFNVLRDQKLKELEAGRMRDELS